MEIRPTSDRSTPSFKEFVDFIRLSTGISVRREIAPETLFERDLGITGDDGWELLEATEDRFGVCLLSPEDDYRSTFGLAPDESLFHDEAWGPGEVLETIISLFWPRATRRSVKAFTVGDLFEAVRHAPPKPVKRYIVPGIED
jgi:hypothetical protein